MVRNTGLPAVHSGWEGVCGKDVSAPGHDHSHAHGATPAALWGALSANAAFLVTQVVAGLLIGSLALLADSAHQATDVVALGVAIAGAHISARAGSASFTYGMRRAEVLGALVNGVLLLSTTVWVTVAAVGRIGEEPDVAGGWLVVVAAVGIGVNAGSAVWLHRTGASDLNTRAAVLHLFADALGSASALVAGVVILVFGVDEADTIAALVVAAIVLVSGLRLLGATVRVLLEAAPPGLDPALVEKELREDARVEEVHHLHLWALDSTTTAMTAHVVLETEDLHEATEIGAELREMLAERFGIDHATLSLECHPCDEPTHSH